MTNCKRCNLEFVGQFCPDCGYPQKIPRIDKSYLLHELQHLIYFEKGFFYTVKELFIRPGSTIRRYILEDRNAYIKPTTFLIFASIIYSIVNSIFHVENSEIFRIILVQTAVSTLVTWVQTHWGYANVIMALFIAIFLKWFFKRSNYNIYEILVLLIFVMGQGMIILSINCLFIYGFSNIFWIKYASKVIFLIYLTWSIGQFFNTGKARSYFFALLSYFLGMLSFAIAIVAVGLTIDSIVKSKL